MSCLMWKNSSFLKVVQSLKREPYLRNSFVGFFTSVVEINDKNQMDFNVERNAMAANWQETNKHIFLMVCYI